MKRSIETKSELSTNCRAPIVTVMGHVDHGKTTLLDYIRKTRVAEREYGGITQQIRSFQVVYHGLPITFVDTPGHEAFVSMRERGANITDILLLVVAADDSVMPQTREVINLWSKTKSHLLVAINKIDIPGANAERVKNDLAKEGVFLEGYGGDIPYVEISAKNGTNVDNLLELINLIAELNDLHKFIDLGNVDYKAEAIVLESYLDKSLGPVLSVILKSGSIKRGYYIVGGNVYSRLRAIMDDSNLTIDDAVESMPVRLVGMPCVLEAGEIIRFYDKEILARNASKERSFNEQKIEQRERFTKDYLKTLLLSEERQQEIKKLSLMVIADTKGSLEAINYALQKLDNFGDVKLDIVLSKVGLVTNSDVDMAKLKNSVVLAFNIKKDQKVWKYAELNKVLIQEYKVIYELIDDVKEAMQRMVDVEESDVVLGEGLILQVFELSNGKFVIGTRVNKGKFLRNMYAKVLDGDNVLHEGKISSLRHFKDEVKEVTAGMDCGILLEPNAEVPVNKRVICIKK